MRAFSAEGTLHGVQTRLDSIRALGVNTIRLMPIYPGGQLRSVGQRGSPYSVRNCREVNPEPGTIEDLRALVKAAHARHMAEVLEWVANHASWDNPRITPHKDKNY
jgi:glycosidase